MRGRVFGTMARLGLGLLLLLGGLLLSSCSTDETGETRIDWNLSDSLKNYSNVVITLVDPNDTSKVIAVVHQGKLESPKDLESFKVPDSLAGKFKIVIRGYDDKGLLAFESKIEVTEGMPSTPVRTPKELLPAFQEKPISTVGMLRVLDVSEGVLKPDFQPYQFGYTVEVPYDIVQIAVHAVADSATLTLNGDSLLNGEVSAPVSLAVGTKTLTVAVKIADGSVKSYTIAVSRKAGDIARLASLSVSTGTLSPVFDPDTLEYSVTVPADVDTVSVFAASADPLASLVSGGVPLDSALGKVVALAPGANATVQLTITSRDNSASVTYVVDLKRALSTDASLTSLMVTGTELTPEFFPDSLTYAAKTAQAQVAVLPVARDKGAKIKVNGTAVASGSLSTLINAPAANATADVKVEVTAADGAVKTYTIKLTRIAQPGGLMAITLNGKTAVTLDSAFRIDRLSYKGSVPRGDTAIFTTVIIAGPWLGLDQNLVVTVNGAASKVTSQSQSNNITTVRFDGSLKLGLNLVRVTYQEAVYTFRITRTLSKEADLSQLAVSAGTLKPAFSATVLSYADTVPNSASVFRVTATPKDSLAMVIVKLKRWVPIFIPRKIAAADTPIFVLPLTTLATDTLAPGVPSDDLPLAVGSNTVEVTVVAEDTSVKKIYTIVVERRASANARLAGLSVHAGTKVALALNPAFAAGTFSYASSTTSGFVTVTPTAGETGQAITVNGKAVATATASSSITLGNGSNSIKVEVTAPDKVSKATYTLNITKTVIRAVEP